MTALEFAELLAEALRGVDGLVVGEPQPDGSLFAALHVRRRGGGFAVTVEQVAVREESDPRVSEVGQAWVDEKGEAS